MAQSGYTPILIYASGTATNVPLAANMTSSASGAELALNYADGKLYYKNSSGVVTLLASSTTVTNSFSAGTTGFTPSTATTGAVTLGGTLITSNGGTGLASYTAGDLSYYASGTALTKLAIGTAGQFLTSTGTAPQWSTLSGVAVTTFSAGTTGFTPNTATSGAITLAGTLATTNGGTGLTSFTSGGVVYASSSSALATGSAFIWTGGTAQLGFQNAAANGYAYIGNAGAGTNTDLAFYMGATEGMRLTSTGLGIGTSSPTTRLTVNSAGSGDALIVQNAATTAMYIHHGTQQFYGYIDTTGLTGTGFPLILNQSGGNVGIGNTSPNSKLEITSTGTSVTAALALSNYQGGADGYGSKISFRGQRGAPNAQVEYGYIQTVMNDWAGTPNMQMGIMGGNVGIGTTSPAGVLHVAGNNGQLRLSGAGYQLNPTEFTLGQYTSTRGYLQVPGGSTGQIEIWDGNTNQVIVFNAYGVGLYGSAGTSGSGVTFPSTQQASSNANTLDDYEEGTWSPQLWSDANQGTSYTSQTGYYTKVGRLVTCWFGVQCTLVGGTYLRLYGLPYSVGTSGTGYQSVAYSNGSGGSTSAYIETYLGTGGQVFQGATGYLNPASFSGTFFGGVYQFYASA